jgi:hypothetical protein
MLRFSFALHKPAQQTGTMTRHQPGPISPGDIYEDCAFHPVLCTSTDDDAVSGISLIDATSPRVCSLSHCGVIKLAIADVLEARADFPAYRARRTQEIGAETAVAEPAGDDCPPR